MPSLSAFSHSAKKRRAGALFSALCITRRQFIIFVPLLVVFFILLASIGMLAYLVVKGTAVHEVLKLSAEESMKHSFQPACNFIISVWYLNFCYSDATKDAYAWRRYQAINRSTIDCLDMIEKVPCMDQTAAFMSNVRVLDNPSTEALIHCPVTSEEELTDLDFRRKIIATVANDELVMGKLMRPSDLIMICPLCMKPALSNSTNALIDVVTLRSGWPLHFYVCQDNSTDVSSTQPTAWKMSRPFWVPDNWWQ